jgi:2-alkenal reductase
VAIDSAKRSMDELIRRGKVSYAYVGITTENLTPSLARRLGYPVTHGAIVDEVVPGDPGAAAGLRAGTETVHFEGVDVKRGGDVIVAIDGSSIRSADDVVRYVSTRLRPGQTATFAIVRGGHRREVRVTLAERTQSSG